MSRLADGLPHARVTVLLDAEARRLARRKVYRKRWLNVHLYLALAVGFVFVLLGLTGSYNAFMHELDEVWNPDLVITRPGTAYRSLEEPA